MTPQMCTAHSHACVCTYLSGQTAVSCFALIGWFVNVGFSSSHAEQF